MRVYLDRYRKWILCALIFFSTVIIYGCSLSPNQKTLNKANIKLWPIQHSPLAKNAAIEQKIDHLLDKMTLEQKIGQMTQGEITWTTPEDVKKYHLGSVLNGGGSFLHGKRHASIEEWVDFMDAIYDASMDTSDGGLAIPVTYGIDAVHGNNKFGHATIFPHNIGLGATRNPELLKRIGEITALEVLATGIDWTFAPTLAVVRDDRWGRTYESYSEDPAIVAEYAKAMTEGVQGKVNSDSFLNEDHVYATAKHWLGDGSTTSGIDQGNTELSEKDMIRLQAKVYLPALDAGIQSIMASHNAWFGNKLHGHRYLLTEILKHRLGFDGFVVGDWNAHANIKGCTVTDCAQAVNAGIDMFMVVEDYPEFIATTAKHVREGRISQARINDAVRRILRVKIRSGLFEKGRPSSRKYARNVDLMGREAHRHIAQQAVRESLVLLKNNNQLLPLSPTSKILVAGNGANNIAKQTGGWTISWQSDENTMADFTGASTILDGIRHASETAGGQLEFSENGEYTRTPDVAIVVFGENPYAEWYGDIKTLEYSPFTETDRDLLKKLKQEGIPIVSIFLSGRPMWMNREINDSDAFVAAWLPGSEGKTIANVLFTDSEGHIQHDFKGKLSFSWPKRPSQSNLNIHDKHYGPLFPYGYGLSYSDTHTLEQLPEINDTHIEVSTHSPYPLFKGKITQPWQVLLSSLGNTVFPSASRHSLAGISVMEADKALQGDAKEFRWTGESMAIGGFSSPYYRHNLEDYVRAGGTLQFDVRTINTPQADLELNVACASGYCGQVILNEHLPSAESTKWKTIRVDLRCFTKKGAELARSSAPFTLRTNGKAVVRVANIEYLLSKPDENTLLCE